MQQLNRIPRTIDANTPPPITKAEARLYPDTSKWMQVIDIELDTLDERMAVNWNEHAPPGTRPIPFITNFEYKREKFGNIVYRKSRFALHGDLMLPDIHFDPRKTSAPTADKATIRTLVAIAAQNDWPMEHMDMKFAYINTLFKYWKAVYVREPPRSDGK